jgi:hypothetical protein
MLVIIAYLATGTKLRHRKCQDHFNEIRVSKEFEGYCSGCLLFGQMEPIRDDQGHYIIIDGFLIVDFEGEDAI